MVGSEGVTMKTGMLALGRGRLERLVILVDVRVFALQGNPKAALTYATLIHSCVERMLAACNEHSTGYKRGTMWAFKFFDSSLSPLASRSRMQALLGKNLPLVRFNTAEENLGTFQQNLRSVADESNIKGGGGGCLHGEGKLEFVIRALQELLSEYSWDPLFLSDGSSSDEDQVRQMRSVCPGANFLKIEQNVVILFSHIPSDEKHFASFVSSSTSVPVSNTDLIKCFSSKLGTLKEPFGSHNIHASWINVPSLIPSLSAKCQMPNVPDEAQWRLQQHVMCSVFAGSQWGYMAMETLAIASDCIPLSMLWSSIAYPAPHLQSNNGQIKAKLQIHVQGRDAVQLEQEVCKLVAVRVGSNVVDSRSMKENISELLQRGASSRRMREYFSEKSPVGHPAQVKIVVKSLQLKQKLDFKGSARYVLYHHLGGGQKDVSSLQDGRSHEDEVASNSYGDEILRQLQQEPMTFRPGQRAWQVLLIAIARRQSVAEVDLYEDGICSQALLEPITVQYAALLQKEPADSWGSGYPESNDVQGKVLIAPIPCTTMTTFEGVANAPQKHLVGDKCSVIKKEGALRKRSASAITGKDSPPAKREKAAGDTESIDTKENAGSKVQAYNWVNHWRFILQRQTVGTGKNQIENKYLRPGHGKRPSRNLVTIRYWLDHLLNDKEQAPQQIQQVLPVLQETAECAEPEPEVPKVDEGCTPVSHVESARTSDSPVTPIEKEARLRLLDIYTDEQAEAFLTSIDQMVHDCLKAEYGEVQPFVKSLVCNAQMAQRVLTMRDLAKKIAPVSTEVPIISDMNCGLLTHNSEQDLICLREEVCESYVDNETLGAGQDVHVNDNVGLAATQDVLSSELAFDIVECETIRLDSWARLCFVDESEHVAMEVDGVVALNNSEMKSGIDISWTDERLEEEVANQLMKKLLVKPKKLAKQYKDCQPTTLPSPGMISKAIHTAEEKLRIYELQILFRMELLGRDNCGPLEKQKTTLVKEICKLLDDILFLLGGGVFGGESLHDYSIRVIQNRYKDRLPITVSAIFDSMEFNGYAEPISESHPALETINVIENMEAALNVNETLRDGVQEEPAQVVTIPDEADSTIKTSKLIREQKLPRTKGKKKSKVPIFEDEFARASEKRKLASKLTHFGTLDSHHRVKKIKLNVNQAQKLPQVSSSTLAKLQPREHRVVMETPMVNRRELFSETPVVPQENTEVESPLKVLVGGGFGFGTPARVARQNQPTARKRRLLLGNHKKPPGRGLPKIALEVMKAKRELQKTMTEREYRSFGPGSFLEEEELHAFTDDAGAADTTNFVSLSTQGREEPLALDELEALGPLEATGFSNHDIVVEDNRYAHPEALLSQRLPKSGFIGGCNSKAVATQVDMNSNTVHEIDKVTVMGIMATKVNTRNRRKSVRASKSKKVNLPHCSPNHSRSPAFASRNASPASNGQCPSPQIVDGILGSSQVADHAENYSCISQSISPEISRRKSPRFSQYLPSMSPVDSEMIKATPVPSPEKTQILEQEGTMVVRVLDATPVSDAERNGKQSPNGCAELENLKVLSSPEMRNTTRSHRNRKDSPLRISRSLKVFCLDPATLPMPNILSCENSPAEPKCQENVLGVNRSGKKRILQQLKRHVSPTNICLVLPLEEQSASEGVEGPVCVDSVKVSQGAHRKPGPGRRSNRKSLFPAVPCSTRPDISPSSKMDHVELEHVSEKTSQQLIASDAGNCQKQLEEFTEEFKEELLLQEHCASASTQPRLRPEARLSTPRAHNRKNFGPTDRVDGVPTTMKTTGKKENSILALKRRMRRPVLEGSPGQRALNYGVSGSKKKPRSVSMSPH